MIAKRYLVIAVGGACGASLRWLVGDLLENTGFHWAILIVNVVGCLMLGALLGEEARTERHRIWLQDFGAIGFCGGLTTMSTFSLDVVQLLNSNCYGRAAAYLGANVVLGLGAVVAGAALVRRTMAVEREVEGRP